MESSSSLLTGSVTKITTFTILIVLLLSLSTLAPTEAFDSLDPTGNITLKWDVIQWTPDGYVAVVTMYNFQQFRHIQAPGWTLGWTWPKEEVIWSMLGSKATDQGDCSEFIGKLPHCCKKDPTVVDLLPGTPYNQQIANCCKGGVIHSWAQDPANAVSSFQIHVGAAGTSKKTIRTPTNFTLKAPGAGYSCGPAKMARATTFLSADERRTSQSLRTWDVTCIYTQVLAQKTPTCCVSFSSFYYDTTVSCPTCACGCQNSTTGPGSGTCVRPDTPHLASLVSSVGKSDDTTLVQCTHHMCPIQVHWHFKLNGREYWQAKIVIVNFNYRMNYSLWNIVVQHPNFDNLTKIFSFNYKALTPHEGLNDTAMLWGVKSYNEFLPQAGPLGNVQSELLFRKGTSTLTFRKGWPFPRSVYFNGDYCMMPPPGAYPWFPNDSSPPAISQMMKIFGSIALYLSVAIALLFVHMAFLVRKHLKKSRPASRYTESVEKMC